MPLQRFRRIFRSPQIARTGTTAFRRSLGYENLEGRDLLAVVTVTTAEDIVDVNDGVTSLREAIFATNVVPGPDEIVFSLNSTNPTPIVLTEGELRISDDLILTGPGADALIIDASGNDPTPTENNGDGSRVFQISGGGRRPIDVSIAGITLTGGDVSDSGGAILASAQLTVTDVVIVDNYAGLDGGGLQVSQTAVIENTQILNNESGGNGGGIRVFSGADVEIHDSTLAGNVAGGDGGGLWSIRFASTSLFGSSVTENVAARFGGGLGLSNETAKIYDTTIAGNVGLEGGSIFASSSTVDLQRSDIANNRASDSGGGLGLQSSDVTVQDSFVRGNFTNQNESRGGGIAQRGGTLTIQGSDLTNNKARASFTSGGAIYVDDVILSVAGGQIIDNLSTLSGSGIAATLSAVSLDDTAVSNNSGAEFGGALWTSKSSLSIEDSTFQFNSASIDGGALFAEDSSISINTASFENNEAREGHGGAIALAPSQQTLTILAGNFVSNRSGVRGGAIDDDSWGTTTISSSTFSFNQTGQSGGGAIYSGFSSELQIADSALFENRSDGVGGAIASNGMLDVASSAVMNNSAQLDGGGIYASSFARGARPINIEATTIAHNQTDTRGGGIYLQRGGSDFSLINSTLSNNHAQLTGGGIHIDAGRGGGRNNDVRHSTIAFNRAAGQEAGAGIHLSGGELTLDHSIVSQNESSDRHIDLSGGGSAIVDVHFGLIGAIAPGTIVTASNLLLGVDPYLFGLASNSEESPLPGNLLLLTHQLSAQSPAVDAGDPSLVPGIGGVPEFDQRGAPYSRVVQSPDGATRAIDLGAFELQTRPTDTFHADFDGDTFVSGHDFLLWQRNAGQSQGATREAGDAVGDGDVDENDLAVWQATYGEYVPNAGDGPRRAILADEVTNSASAIDLVFDAAWLSALSSKVPMTSVSADDAEYDGLRESLDPSVVPLATISDDAVPVGSRLHRQVVHDLANGPDPTERVLAETFDLAFEGF
ncbi:MAG: CSLREA domain-containing protein [Planctomycetota bacterium]